MEKVWKILDKKDISPSKWRRMERWKIKTPQGDEMDADISMVGDAVVVFGITKDKKVLLLEQFFIAEQDYFKTLPAGFVDGSSPEETAKRELKEEAGCEADKFIFLGKTLRSKWAVGELYFYLATGVEKKYEQELEYAEDIKVGVVDFKEFKNYFEKGEIHDVASVSCIAFALNYIQKYEKELGL